MSEDRQSQHHTGERPQATRTLEPRQIKAIKRSAELGIIMQRDHPEILTMYRGRIPKPEIVRRKGFTSMYNVPRSVALGGVKKAFRGHNGSFGVRSYEGMADPKELDEIKVDIMRANGIAGAQAHIDEGVGICFMTKEEKQRAASLGGAAAHLLRKGVHAMTREQLIAQGRASGTRGGATARDRKLGVFALTREQLRGASKKGVIARGQSLWTPAKLAFVTECAIDPKYQHGSFATNPGKPNWRLIAQAANVKFHGGENVLSARAACEGYARPRRKSALKAKEPGS